MLPVSCLGAPVLSLTATTNRVALSRVNARLFSEATGSIASRRLIGPFFADTQFRRWRLRGHVIVRRELSFGGVLIVEIISAGLSGSGWFQSVSKRNEVFVLGSGIK